MDATMDDQLKLTNKVSKEDIGLLASSNDLFSSDSDQSIPGTFDNGDASNDAMSVTETDLDQAIPDSQWKKIAFALGAFPSMATHTVLGFFLSTFLLEVAFVSPAIVSVCTFAGRAWDAVMDPVVGHIATHTRTRFGSLRPWIFASLLPCAATYFFLWVVPDISTEAKAAYYILLYLANQTCFSFYQVPYTSLTMHVSHDPRQRDIATTYRLVVETLALMMGSIFQGYIIAEIGTNGGTSGCKNCTNVTTEWFQSSSLPTTPIILNTTLDAASTTFPSVTELPTLLVSTTQALLGSAGIAFGPTEKAYIIAASIICALSILFGLVVVFGVRENVTASARGQKKSFFKNLKFALSQKTYVLLILMFLWAWMASQVNQANFILWMKYGFNREAEFQNLMVTLLVGNTVCLPLWFIVIQLIGKHRALAAGLCVNIPLNIVMYNLPPDVPTWGLHLQLGAASIGLGAVYLAPWAMLPDVIDDVQVKTGQRADSVFYSFFVFFQKFGAGIAIGLSVLCLQFAGYSSPLCCGEAQPTSVANTLRYLVSFVPLVLNFTSLVITAFYPLTKEKCVRNKLILAERRKQSQSQVSNYEDHLEATRDAGSEILEEAMFSDGEDEDFDYLKQESSA